MSASTARRPTTACTSAQDGAPEASACQRQARAVSTRDATASARSLHPARPHPPLGARARPRATSRRCTPLGTHDSRASPSISAQPSDDERDDGAPCGPRARRRRSRSVRGPAPPTSSSSGARAAAARSRSNTTSPSERRRRRRSRRRRRRRSHATRAPGEGATTTTTPTTRARSPQPSPSTEAACCDGAAAAAPSCTPRAPRESFRAARSNSLGEVRSCRGCGYTTNRQNSMPGHETTAPPIRKRSAPPHRRRRGGARRGRPRRPGGGDARPTTGVAARRGTSRRARRRGPAAAAGGGAAANPLVRGAADVGGGRAAAAAARAAHRPAAGGPRGRRARRPYARALPQRRGRRTRHRHAPLASAAAEVGRGDESLRQRRPPAHRPQARDGRSDRRGARRHATRGEGGSALPVQGRLRRRRLVGRLRVGRRGVARRARRQAATAACRSAGAGGAAPTQAACRRRRRPPGRRLRPLPSVSQPRRGRFAQLGAAARGDGRGGGGRAAAGDGGGAMAADAHAAAQRPAKSPGRRAGRRLATTRSRPWAAAMRPRRWRTDRRGISRGCRSARPEPSPFAFGAAGAPCSEFLATGYGSTAGAMCNVEGCFKKGAQPLTIKAVISSHGRARAR